MLQQVIKGFIGALLLIAAYGLIKLYPASPPGLSDAVVQPARAILLPATYEEGKALFEANCTSCHPINKKCVRDIANAESRWPNRNALIQFIKDPTTAIETYPYARALWLEYDKIMQLPFPELSDAQVSAILDYLAAQR
jgi:mono/diheme cytochrome c family protein